MSQFDNKKDLHVNKAQKQQDTAGAANKLKWPPLLEQRPTIYKSAS
jgi:hypothetical protein